MEIRFGDFRLLKKERRLVGPAGEVALGDRSFDILSALLDRPDAVVDKNDLLDAVWPGVAVAENALQVHVSALRRAIGPDLIRTVHGRGYQYVGPAPHGGAAAPATAGERRTTSLAVLPFASATDDPHLALLADGAAEDLIGELARYRHLSVVGHRLSSQFRGAETDLAEAARRLFVDFIIDGSVRRYESAVRIAVRLIDTGSGAHVWGARFDREAGDLLSIQDEIVGAVVAKLAFNLDEAAERQRRRDPTTSEGAYVQFLLARSSWRAGDAVKALASAERALEIDPSYARAHAYVAYFLAFDLFGQWYGLSEAESVRRARKELDLSLAMDRSDPFILQRAGMTLLMLGEPAAGLRYVDAAALESAKDSEILVNQGLCLGCCGRKEEGAAMLEQALALEPRLAPGCYSALAEVRHLQGDYAASLAALDAVAEPPPYFGLLRAANLARLGRMAEAAAARGDAPEGYDAPRTARREAMLCLLPEDRDHWLESFRLAGVDV